MLSLGSNRVATGDSPSWLAMECHLLAPHGGSIFAFILFVSTPLPKSARFRPFGGCARKRIASLLEDGDLCSSQKLYVVE